MSEHPWWVTDYDTEREEGIPMGMEAGMNSERKRVPTPSEQLSELGAHPEVRRLLGELCAVDPDMGKRLCKEAVEVLCERHEFRTLWGMVPTNAA